VDKIIRLIIGVALALWAVLSAGLSSPLSYIALAAGVILIVTALMNFCPLFRILGISTRKA
jgi:hypothetical protein